MSSIMTGVRAVLVDRLVTQVERNGSGREASSSFGNDISAGGGDLEFDFTPEVAREVPDGRSGTGRDGNHIRTSAQFSYAVVVVILIGSTQTYLEHGTVVQGNGDARPAVAGGGRARDRAR